MTCEDQVQDRQRSFEKRVICPARRGTATTPSGAESGGWTAEQEHWCQLRTVILDALDGFPGARAAVVRALVELRDLKEGEDG